jgi:hypothetical protein
MPRKTRAAAKAQDVSPDDGREDVEDAAADEDEASTVPLPPTPTKQDRGALRNITPNTSEITETEEPVKDEMKRSKGSKKSKNKKKGKKGKADKGQVAPEDMEVVEEQAETAAESAEPIGMCSRSIPA